MTSYDDGTINDITLAKTLTAYGMKATFNLNDRAFRKEGYLQKEDVEKYILSEGHEVAILNPDGKNSLMFRYPRLLFMWGHGVEFADNWDILEGICKKLSGKSDIWYATNIEIYNYVEAYNSLIYSADERLIYNPTLYDIFFAADGKTYCVESGKTITIGGN